MRASEYSSQFASTVLLGTNCHHGEHHVRPRVRQGGRAQLPQAHRRSTASNGCPAPRFDCILRRVALRGVDQSSLIYVWRCEFPVASSPPLYSCMRRRFWLIARSGASSDSSAWFHHFACHTHHASIFRLGAVLSPMLVGNMLVRDCRMAIPQAISSFSSAQYSPRGAIGSHRESVVR